MKVMNPTFSANIAKWTEEILQWEQEIEKYHALSSDRVPEAISVAGLVRGAPPQIRNHLQLQAVAFGTDYLKAKRVIESYVQAVRVWTG